MGGATSAARPARSPGLDEHGSQPRQVLLMLGEQRHQGRPPAVAGELPSSAVRYNEIKFSSAAITASSVTTSGASGGRPASGSGPANMSEDRQPAVASSMGSAVAEASRMRRLGRMSGTPASYHGRSAGPEGVSVNGQIG